MWRPLLLRGLVIYLVACKAEARGLAMLVDK